MEQKDKYCLINRLCIQKQKIDSTILKYILYNLLQLSDTALSSVLGNHNMIVNHTLSLVLVQNYQVRKENLWHKLS